MARHFRGLVFFLPQQWGGRQDKAQAWYCCCWDFQEDVTAAGGDHAPMCPAAIQHTPLPQPSTLLESKVPIDCHVLPLWSACRWAPEHFSITYLPLNHGIAMDQLWQLMTAFGTSWVFSGIRCKLNISLVIHRILYVLTKPLQLWSLSVSLT